jgi:hypothetical protein
MPFTPCHIAAVLPLRKRAALLPLAVGSMVPDLGYYFSPFEYFVTSAHTLTRSLTFCIPMGVLILLFIRLTEKGWRTLLPVKFEKKMLAPLSWATPLLIWFGALTHIFWDAWTHPTGYFVELWPWLPYSWLQHISTIVGGVLLLWVYLKEQRFRPPWNRPGIVFLDVSLIIAVGVTEVGFSPGDPHALADRRRLFLWLTSVLGDWLLIVAFAVVLVMGRGVRGDPGRVTPPRDQGLVGKRR